MTGLTILLPCAGRSRRYPNLRPKWMLVTPEGDLMLERALASVANLKPERVVVGLLQEHEDRYSASSGIKRALGDAVEFVFLAEDTRGPADTVHRMIQEAGVEGRILVRDSDSWFSVDSLPHGNVVCIADLAKNPEVMNVAAKSFVTFDSQGIITNIYEKTVCSDYISIGGYGWEDAKTYARLFETLEREVGNGELFVSHLISRAMMEGEIFHVKEVDNLVEVGTMREWQRYRNRRCALFLDVDGVVLRNAGEYFPPLWDDEDIPIQDNVDHLLALQEEGAQFVFVTARPERYREKLEATLGKLGLEWHAVVMGCYHSRRIIVNDFANSNPHPACQAVNLPRNSDRLAEFLPRA